MKPGVSDPARWLDALRSSQEAVDELGGKGVLIGGVAVSLRAEPRFTADVDYLLWQGDLGLMHILLVLQRYGLEPRAQDPISFASRARVFPMTHTESGFKVDVVLGSLPFERDSVERSERFDLGDFSINLATAEDLFVMKLVAARQSDLADAEAIAKSHPNMDVHLIRRNLEIFAEALDQPGILREAIRILGR